MEYKQLLDVSNFTIGAIMRSIYRMGLSGELITTQITDEYAAQDMIDLLKDSGLDVSEAGQQELLDSFISLMEKLGAVQDVKITSSSDSAVEIVLQDCVFNTATALTRSSHPDALPVCPWVSILAASLLRTTGKNTTVSSYSWDESKNACTFKIEVE